jgi:Class II flagellar assembly regulator
MRVSRTGGPKGPKEAAPSGRTSRGAFALPTEGAGAEPVSESAAAGEASSIVSVAETLLALQDRQDRKAAVGHGLDTLAGLRELQLAVLAGEIDRPLAERMVALIQRHYPEISDPEIQEALDTIEFRLRFELARLTKAARP